MARIFKRLTSEDQTIVNQETTTGLWTGDTGSLTTFALSTAQLAKGNSKYYFDVYNADPSLTSSADVQFSVAYGHISGAGSPTLDQSDTSTLATRATYLQYKNILLDPDDTAFSFANDSTPDDIYVVNISRQRYKGYIDPGNWQLTLSGTNGSFKFIDDSLQTLGTRRSFAKNGLVFNIVSGSLSGASGSTIATSTGSNGQGFGLFYPQKGIFVFNATEIANHVGFTGRVTGDVGDVINGGEHTGSAQDFVDTLSASNPMAPFTASLTGTGGTYYEQYNHYGMVRSIESGADFQARSAEIISSTHYFLRLTNREYNYSNNPTFSTGSNGQITNEDFATDPRVYVTTIGLYSDSNECLAVAKLSRPLEKSFSKEALIRVRLDF